ncbi:STAS domain-containing protein [Chitinispirillales bacterium ANBcel5]|uniref:STAS domain-containing protein n=1 Tax=Cellulosispirillum alkaliphilum TaxID=3039283 RepID=UPI002A56E90F|nr:STAS domain-containing protein [Chitinispirillales bacterium ANBcel5]
MESQIELTCEEIQGKSNAKLLHFVGDLDATNVEMVLENICELYNDGYVNLVANFNRLRYVNSTGLGILLHCSKSAKEKGGSFKIASVNENVYEIIEIIGATSLLEIYDEVEEAVAALK